MAGVYVPEILARGLTPVDWTGYLVQQRRWAGSVLDIKLRQHQRFSKSLSLRTRLMSLLPWFELPCTGVLSYWPSCCSSCVELGDGLGSDFTLRRSKPLWF